MSGFPTLKPAMTVKVEIGLQHSVGSASKGTPLNVVPITGGAVQSHSDYHVQIDAAFQGQGADYIRIDPDQKRMRLDAHAIAKDKSEALFYIHYTGIVEIDEAVAKILGQSADMKTTEFGKAFIEMRFETGDSVLKELETNVYAGAGRFIVEQGRPVTVEYKLSQVAWSG